MNKISVIIPNHSNRNIDKLISEVKKFKPLEIIVVNNKNNKLETIKSNNTSDILKYYNFSEKKNASSNRNYGASKAQGDFLLFIDNDVLVDSEYIYNNFVIAEIKYDLIFGMYSEINNKIDFLNHFQNKIQMHRTLEGNMFSSSHFLIKKEMFKNLNGFNEELNSYEDCEFYHRCIHEEVSSFFDKKFLGIHLKKHTLISLLKDYYFKASDAIYIRKKLPLIFKNINYKTIGLKSKLYFLFFPFFSFLVIASFFFNFVNIDKLPVFIFFYFFLNYFIFLKLFKIKNIVYFFKSTIFSAIISSVLVIVTLKCHIYNFFSSTKSFFLNVFDYLRMFKRILVRNGYPIQIIHYVTSRCNLRCHHCFYKETLDKKDPGEQELQIFKKTSKQIGPVLWYALAGGEVFIRKDIVKLLSIIIENSRPKYISIPTNGWYTERTSEFMNQILRKYPNIFFSLYFSIDGHKEVHDEIRGENSYNRVRETYFKLKKLQKYYKNFNLNIVTVINDKNYKNSENFIENINNEFKPNTIGINLFRYHSLKHPKLPDHLVDSYIKATDKYFDLLDEKKVRGLKSVFSNILLFKDKIQKFIITKVAKYDEFVTPCTAGNLSYVIMEDGKIKPCEILDDSIGNVINDNDISAIFTSNKAKKLRKEITDTKCKCTYECAMSTNALFSWPMTKKYFGLISGNNKI